MRLGNTDTFVGPPTELFINSAGSGTVVQDGIETVIVERRKTQWWENPLVILGVVAVSAYLLFGGGKR